MLLASIATFLASMMVSEKIDPPAKHHSVELVEGKLIVPPLPEGMKKEKFPLPQIPATDTFPDSSTRSPREFPATQLPEVGSASPGKQVPVEVCETVYREEPHNIVKPITETVMQPRRRIVHETIQELCPQVITRMETVTISETRQRLVTRTELVPTKKTVTVHECRPVQVMEKITKNCGWTIKLFPCPPTCLPCGHLSRPRLLNRFVEIQRQPPQVSYHQVLRKKQVPVQKQITVLERKTLQEVVPYLCCRQVQRPVTTTINVVRCRHVTRVITEYVPVEQRRHQQCVEMRRVPVRVRRTAVGCFVEKSAVMGAPCGQLSNGCWAFNADHCHLAQTARRFDHWTADRVFVEGLACQESPTMDSLSPTNASPFHAQTLPQPKISRECHCEKLSLLERLQARWDAWKQRQYIPEVNSSPCCGVPGWGFSCERVRDRSCTSSTTTKGWLSEAGAAGWGFSSGRFFERFRTLFQAPSCGCDTLKRPVRESWNRPVRTFFRNVFHFRLCCECPCP